MSGAPGKPLHLPAQALTVPSDEHGASLGYLLTQTHARMTQRITHRALAELGVTGVQGKVLFLLAAGHCETAADLARECCVDASAITRVLDRVESRGLLQRVRALEDRRVVRLALTAAGCELAAAMPALFEAVRDEGLDGLVAEEAEALVRMLKRILANGG
ncbi:MULTISPECIES: MarR family winged helix-turn-helix transcriptional regulator [Burkholderia]|uniref:MarR family transcriptional regulator n=1 Tax=Burkholderia gladioli TaxID=28095 RepID=A0A2A7RZV6_BURGA|nr:MULTISPECIES: MarR family winged helix-turn-helix transcriptional regulator [Burkholderia]ATF86364.1 MarR family transcriptional regulator [Burkholderia gladioli pv. gladioli]MBJ9710952.1 winged helix-turn-helix transcriptional regulator [Burkholderia gladioli]MBU9155755.1 MarR family winged helix-turn-helix transcriptional regulator [Burkholderia gladioli]MBU9166839.1 MarR family winged helix-turn-helix transcriptional regulator [Burkholderia gladioli]MBU9194396.1 MarR family winged helix-